MNRRQILLGTAALAGATALPAPSPATAIAVARAQALRRYDAAGDALVRGNCATISDAAFERVYAAYLKAVDETDALFTWAEKLDYMMHGRVPADVAAVDPTWAPRGNG